MATSDLLATSKRILQLKKEGRIEQALQRAEALTVEHPGEAITHCVLGDVNFAAAVRAREAAAGSEEEPAYGMSPSETHIRIARDALFEAKALAPDSVDIALALANILIESRMFSKAEAEYRLALQMDMDSTTAAIQAISGPFSSTPKQRSEACQRLANRLVSYEVSCIMATDSGSIQNTGSGENGGGALTTEVKPSLHSGKMDGGVALKAADGMPLTDGGLQKPDALAMKMSKEARSLANRFPGSARAQLCYLLVQLQYMRSLPRNLNMSKGVKRLVNSARSAAQAFPNSVLIAMFHAKLLLLSGRLDLAAAECHRAIYLEDVTDPEEECVPPGSIEGHDLQARLSSVAGDFELLLKKIIESAEKCWENSLTTDIKRRFLLVKISALQNEYSKVDKSPGSNIQSALNFIKQNDSWRFWMCPLCSSNKRHSTSSLLMDHMHKKHARIFLPRLKSVISSTLDSDSDGLCHGMSFTQDKDNHDIIQFEERSGLFRWLFSAAIRGEKARPFDKIAQVNRTQGTELLEIMKQKMASLPTEKSTTYESPMLDEIREIWLQFLKSTVFDYGKILLTLARTLLWSEFKEHMAGVLKDGCQNITADDVDDERGCFLSNRESKANKCFC